MIDFRVGFSSVFGTSWPEFWRVLGVKLGVMLAKISIIWPLVGNLAEISKSLKNYKFSIYFEALGLPTSRPNRQKNVPKAIKNRTNN